MIFISKIYYTEQYLERLNMRYKEKIEEANYLNEVSGRARVVRNYLIEKDNAVSILAKFNDLVPDEIYIKSISADKEGNIFITGISENFFD